MKGDFGADVMPALGKLLLPTTKESCANKLGDFIRCVEESVLTWRLNQGKRLFGGKLECISLGEARAKILTNLSDILDFLDLPSKLPLRRAWKLPGV